MTTTPDAVITTRLFRMELATALAYQLAIANQPWQFHMLTSNVISHQRRAGALQRLLPGSTPDAIGPKGWRAWLVRLAMPLVRITGNGSVVALLTQCEDLLLAAYTRASENHQPSRLLHLLLLADLLPAQRRSRTRLLTTLPPFSGATAAGIGLTTGMVVGALLIIGATATMRGPHKTAVMITPTSVTSAVQTTRRPTQQPPIAVIPITQHQQPERPNQHHPARPATY